MFITIFLNWFGQNVAKQNTFAAQMCPLREEHSAEQMGHYDASSYATAIWWANGLLRAGRVGEEVPNPRPEIPISTSPDSIPMFYLVIFFTKFPSISSISRFPFLTDTSGKTWRISRISYQQVVFAPDSYLDQTSKTNRSISEYTSETGRPIKA